MTPSRDDLAPIVLLAYRRPLTTLQTLYTLSRCPEAASSELFVFCDGPRKPSDARDVALTREVVRSKRWCGRVEVEEAERNRGLARSVVAAVSKLCEEHGRVIVLEDDLLVARGFLAYMNEALRRYASDERVMLVSAHTLDVAPPEPRAVFLPYATTWGWATWSRAWVRYQDDPRGIERLDDPAFRRSFNFDGAYDYTSMLRGQLAGRLDSWGIRWWWSVHAHGGLGLFPRASLVKNIGVGGAATHTQTATRELEAATFHLDNEISSWPIDVRADLAACEEWKAFLRRSRPPLTWRTRASRLARNAASRMPEWLARISARMPASRSGAQR